MPNYIHSNLAVTTYWVSLRLIKLKHFNSQGGGQGERFKNLNLKKKIKLGILHSGAEAGKRQLVNIEGSRLRL